jgi:hypothetical protein
LSTPPFFDAAGEPAALLQNVPTGRTRNNYLARLDLHPGNVHTLTGFYGFDELFQTNQGVAGFNLQDDGYSTSLRGHKIMTQLSAPKAGSLFNLHSHEYSAPNESLQR